MIRRSRALTAVLWLASLVACGPRSASLAATPAPDSALEDFVPQAGIELNAAQQAVLDELDDAYSCGDQTRFFELFAPDAHGHPLEVLRCSWESAQLANDPVRRRSTVEHKFAVGTQTAVVIAVEKRHPREPDLVSKTQELALLTAAKPSVRIRLLIDYDDRSARQVRAQGGLVACPPCNFAFRVPTGWLTAPMSLPGSLCMDSIALYHPTRDLCLELAVQSFARAGDACAMIHAVLHELAPGAPSPAPRQVWHPRVLASHGEPPLAGAHRTVDLEGDRRADLYAVTQSGLSYLIGVYGSRAAFAAVPVQIADAVAGFSFLQRDHDGRSRQLEAVGHHTGDGCLEGDRYTHPCGVEVTLPPGWKHAVSAEQRFTVESTSPTTDGKVRVSALAPPRGFKDWSTDLAWRTMRNCCPDWLAEADTGWKSDEDAPMRRRCTRIVDGREEGVLLVCAPKTLVVVHWEASAAACLEAVATLRERLVVKR